MLEEIVGKVLKRASRGVTGKVSALHRYGSQKRDALERWARSGESARHSKRISNGVPVVYSGAALRFRRPPPSSLSSSIDRRITASMAGGSGPFHCSEK